MKDKIKKTYPQISLDRIALGICKIFGLTTDHLRIKTRKRRYLWPRQFAEAIAYNEKHSLHAIGDYFFRDHCTILNSFKRIKREMQVMPEFEKQFKEIYFEVTGDKLIELKFHQYERNHE